MISPTEFRIDGMSLLKQEKEKKKCFEDLMNYLKSKESKLLLPNQQVKELLKCTKKR
jgi:hypothetical protein